MRLSCTPANRNPLGGQRGRVEGVAGTSPHQPADLFELGAFRPPHPREKDALGRRGDRPRLAELLEGLMDGIQAVRDGRPAEATDWLTIIERMNRREPGIQYGVAGVRTNAWQPE